MTLDEGIAALTKARKTVSGDTPLKWLDQEGGPDGTDIDLVDIAAMILDQGAVVAVDQFTADEMSGTPL